MNYVSSEVSDMYNFLRQIIDTDRKSAERLTQGLASNLGSLRERLQRASISTQSKFYSLIRELNPRLLNSLLSDAELYEDLLDKLKMSTATTILTTVLDPLSKAVDMNYLFGAFSASDWVRIVNSAKLNTIRRMLAQDFITWWKLAGAAKGLARALPDADLARLICDEESSLFRLNGLLFTMEKVDTPAAVRMVDKLGELNLENLFSASYSEHVSLFLVKAEQLSHSSAVKIVDRVSNQTYVRLIEANPTQHSFWLLWNIYRVNPNKAKRVAKAKAAHSLLSVESLSALSPRCLALLGLLHLCDLNIRNISLDNADSSRAIAFAFDAEESITVKSLVLVALKARLTSEQFRQLQSNLNGQSLKARVASQPDPQLRELLEGLLSDLVP